MSGASDACSQNAASIEAVLVMCFVMAFQMLVKQVAMPSDVAGHAQEPWTIRHIHSAQCQCLSEQSLCAHDRTWTHTTERVPFKHYKQSFLEMYWLHACDVTCSGMCACVFSRYAAAVCHRRDYRKGAAAGLEQVALRPRSATTNRHEATCSWSSHIWTRTKMAL